MVREISAGGVVIRHTGEAWEIAVIEPQSSLTKGQSVPSRKKASQKLLLSLPKGIVDEGEKPQQTAVREVQEETGITAVPVTKLGDIRYVYTRTWGDQERVFKIVSFYLLSYRSGLIGAIPPEMRIEVKRALWIPLEGAEQQLKHRGEKDMVKKALEYLKRHPEIREG